jgi:hypothetical protein
MTRTILVTVVIASLAAPTMHADLTLTQSVTGKVLGMNPNQQTVVYIKGTKMRSESGDTVTLLDATSRQMILLNAKKKEAEVYDLAKLQADIQKTVGAGEPKVSMTPTGQKKEILGRSCDEYTMNVTMPMSMGGTEGMNVTMTGPVWVAKGAPGTQDYVTFYKTAAANGMFFGSPQQAKAQGAQMKSMTEMYRAFAEIAGVPYQHDMQIKFEGTGMMATMMNKMGGASSSTTVTAASTDPIPDEKFAIPAGYKTVNK